MQKALQQLDLFGMPVEPVTPKAKEKRTTTTVIPPSPAAAAPAEPQPIVQNGTALVGIRSVKLKQPPVAAAVSPVAVATKTPGKRGRKSFKEMDSEIDLIEVPSDEVLNQKLYYSISEVAGWFKVNTSLLRYWENEFDILQPRKTRKGDRLFRVEDIRNLQLIYYLLRQRKFSIDGAKNYIRSNKKEADKQVQLMEALTKFKTFLLELKASL